MAEIKFGTSGWRGVIAEDFTISNARRALIGIARYVRSKNPHDPRIVVGRDPRFLGEILVELAADVLSGHGIRPLVISEPAPTPAIAYEVISSGTDGAINFTASHNPSEYNGIKFSTPDGAPALPEVTRQLEAEIAAVNDDHRITAQPQLRQSIEVKSRYLARLGDLVDFKVIRDARLKIIFDPLWGAGRGYSDSFLRDAGVDVFTLHDCRDVLFGGHAPEPEDHLLEEMRQEMGRRGAHIGIATDGDADRFGILDDDGSFISPNYVIALLFDYLVETREWKNGVAKSVVTTNLVNALAERHGVELHETAVGFKYIGELIKQDKIAIGGEESAGLSIRHHVPEKDGIIAGLLCCEMRARRGISLRRQLEALFAKVGSFYPRRANFRLTPQVKATFTEKLSREPREFCGRKVARVVRTDGLKLILDDGSWICYRLSGTEPVVRVYTEAHHASDLEKLGQAAKDWVLK
jgi:phosphoglucomutase